MATTITINNENYIADKNESMDGIPLVMISIAIGWGVGEWGVMLDIFGTVALYVFPVKWHRTATDSRNQGLRMLHDFKLVFISENYPSTRLPLFTL